MTSPPPTRSVGRRIRTDAVFVTCLFCALATLAAADNTTTATGSGLRAALAAGLAVLLAACAYLLHTRRGR